MAVKYFTVEQANKALPLVERIVADILRDHEVWRDRMSRYELLSAGATSESGESPEQIALRQDVDEMAHRISGYIRELDQIGCVFKGFEQGLVDFHSKREGRDVFLCWRYGEAAIDYWHDLEGGFAARQPLVPEPVSEDS